MNNNFEWQKQQVNERVQDALRDAAAHRISQDKSSNRSFRSISIKTAFLLGAIWFLVGLLVSGCAPSKLAHAEAAGLESSIAPKIQPALRMAKRIQFQDRLWEHALANGQIKPDRSQRSMTMAERIRFKERVLDMSQNSRILGRLSHEIPAWSMADRIRFQDQVEGRSNNK